MSKIYEALEKAERERKSTRKNIESEKKIIEVGRIPVVEKAPGVEKTPTAPKSPMEERPGDRLILPTGLDAIAAEEFRKLRTMIFHMPASKPVRTILVTSALPQEGKTTVASNLGLVISQGVKEHALLIDCDLRNPSFSPFIRRSTSLGLSDYLMGNLDLANLILRTGAPKLSLLPSGSITSNSAELVGSERMRNLLMTLKSQYGNRYTIIDSPPIMVTTEPIILSEMVDGVIMVVLAGKTPRQEVQRAVSSLNKEKILGIVLNQTKSGPYSYKHYYHYYPQKTGEG